MIHDVNETALLLELNEHVDVSCDIEQCSTNLHEYFENWKERNFNDKLNVCR